MLNGSIIPIVSASCHVSDGVSRANRALAGQVFDGGSG